MGLQYWGNLRQLTYQMFVFHVGGDDPMSRYYSYLRSDSSGADGGYAPITGVKDPVLDQMLDDMAAEIDLNKRKEKFKQVVLRVNEKAYLLPYMRFVVANGWTKKLKNFNPRKYYIIEQGFKEAWLES